MIEHWYKRTSIYIGLSSFDILNKAITLYKNKQYNNSLYEFYRIESNFNKNIKYDKEIANLCRYFIAIIHLSGQGLSKPNYSLALKWRKLSNNININEIYKKYNIDKYLIDLLENLATHSNSLDNWAFTLFNTSNKYESIKKLYYELENQPNVSYWFIAHKNFLKDINQFTDDSIRYFLGIVVFNNRVPTYHHPLLIEYIIEEPNLHHLRHNFFNMLCDSWTSLCHIITSTPSPIIKKLALIENFQNCVDKKRQWHILIDRLASLDVNIITESILIKWLQSDNHLGYDNHAGLLTKYPKLLENSLKFNILKKIIPKLNRYQLNLIIENDNSHKKLISKNIINTVISQKHQLINLIKSIDLNNPEEIKDIFALSASFAIVYLYKHKLDKNISNLTDEDYRKLSLTAELKTTLFSPPSKDSHQDILYFIGLFWEQPHPLAKEWFGAEILPWFKALDYYHAAAHKGHCSAIISLVTASKRRLGELTINNLPADDPIAAAKMQSDSLAECNCIYNYLLTTPFISPDFFTALEDIYEVLLSTSLKTKALTDSTSKDEYFIQQLEDIKQILINKKSDLNNTNVNQDNIKNWNEDITETLQNKIEILLDLLADLSWQKLEQLIEVRSECCLMLAEYQLAAYVPCTNFACSEKLNAALQHLSTVKSYLTLLPQHPDAKALLTRIELSLTKLENCLQQLQTKELPTNLTTSQPTSAHRKRAATYPATSLFWPKNEKALPDATQMQIYDLEALSINIPRLCAA